MVIRQKSTHYTSVGEMMAKSSSSICLELTRGHFDIMAKISSEHYDTLRFCLDASSIKDALDRRYKADG